MGKRILITGGAGFIGSHLVDELLRADYRVRVLDNLTEQVHGPGGRPPAYLDGAAEFVRGDVCNRADVRGALKGVSAVFHLAAAVGVGQSMYEVADYTRTNNLGTAVLLQELIEHPVEKFIVASSMSIYGEGVYTDGNGGVFENAARSLAQLKSGRWEIEDRQGNPLVPARTPESKVPALASVYALSKYDQEQMSLMLGRAYGIPVVALRFFNVYGPRQSISNPYTGVLAIFASRYLNGKPPMIYEDGLQKRDFVSVHDVVRACRLALETPGATDHVANIGSGRCYTIREIAGQVARVLGNGHLEPRITGKYRVGDIRHCFADITCARDLFGFEPQVSLETGLGELAGWLEGQVAHDRVEEATAELVQRGLAV